MKNLKTRRRRRRRRKEKEGGEKKSFRVLGWEYLVDHSSMEPALLCAVYGHVSIYVTYTVTTPAHTYQMTIEWALSSVFHMCSVVDYSDPKWIISSLLYK